MDLGQGLLIETFSRGPERLGTFGGKERKRRRDTILFLRLTVVGEDPILVTNRRIAHYMTCSFVVKYSVVPTI